MAGEQNDREVEKEKLNRMRGTGNNAFAEIQWQDIMRQCKQHMTRRRRLQTGVIVILLLIWWLATPRRSYRVFKWMTDHCTLTSDTNELSQH
jgi:hypothetical protein